MPQSSNRDCASAREARDPRAAARAGTPAPPHRRPVPVPAELRPRAPTHALHTLRAHATHICVCRHAPLLVREGATRKLRGHCRRNLVCQHQYTHATRPRRYGPPPSAGSVIRPWEHPLHVGSDASLMGVTLHGTAAARHMAAAERSIELMLRTFWRSSSETSNE